MVSRGKTMLRIILVAATAALFFLAGEAHSRACGIRLTAKAPEVRGQRSPVGHVLLLGQSAQGLAPELEESGHRVERADVLADARRRRYRVVVADSNQVEAARERFPDAAVIEQRGSRDQLIARVDSAMGRPIRSSTMAREVPIRTSEVRRPISTGPAPRRPRAVAAHAGSDERTAVAAATERPAPPVAQEPEAPAGETTVAVVGERRREPTPQRESRRESKRESRDRSGRPVRVVYFANSSAALSSSTMAKLQRTGRWLQSNADRDVIVEGHANTTGAPAANQALSEARAEAVKRFLVEEGGVDASRIHTAAFGMDRPAFSPGKSGRNRRVIIKLGSE
jgi:outer membrane protein OmpA-like peptidoglycan-associated protein